MEILGMILELVSLSHCVVFLSCTHLINGNENYTPKEVLALSKFRSMVQNGNLEIPEYEKTEAYLVKWLRSKNLNIGDAYQMLANNQKWRAENHMDTILNETIFTLSSEPYNTRGYDLEGHPILILAPFNIDLRKYILGGMSKQVSRYLAQIIESGMSKRRTNSIKFNKEITQIDFIIDAHGFNRRVHACLPCIPVLREIFVSLENHYPYSLRHFVAINVVRAGIPFIEIMKSLLSPGTLKSLRVYSTSRSEWQAALLQFTSRDQLPYRFGGGNISDPQSDFQI